MGGNGELRELHNFGPIRHMNGFECLLPYKRAKKTLDAGTLSFGICCLRKSAGFGQGFDRGNCWSAGR